MRIWLIEQNTLVKNTLEDWLSERAHEVVSLASVRELLEKLNQKSESVDLIITGLPAADRQNLDLMRRVHTRFPQVPCVVMADPGQIVSADDAVSCGVHAYLHKPLRLAELDLVLRRVAEKTRQGSA